MMNSARSIAVAILVGGGAGAFAVTVLAAPWTTAVFIGLAAAVIVSSQSGFATLGGLGRPFPGGRRGRVVHGLMMGMVMGGAMLGVSAFGLERGTETALSLMVLLTGFAAYGLGLMAAAADQADSDSQPQQTTLLAPR
jgi:hypothetical protein